MFQIVVGAVLIIVGSWVIFNLIRKIIKDRKLEAPEPEEDETTKTNESEQ